MKSSKKDFKIIKLSYNIGQHDLETKKRAVDKFLKKNLQVRVELSLRGREKAIYTDGASKLASMFVGYNIINSWNRPGVYFILLK